jgi:hypothetical protein
MTIWAWFISNLEKLPDVLDSDQDDSRERNVPQAHWSIHQEPHSTISPSKLIAVPGQQNNISKAFEA